MPVVLPPLPLPSRQLLQAGVDLLGKCFFCPLRPLPQLLQLRSGQPLRLAASLLLFLSETGLQHLTPPALLLPPPAWLLRTSLWLVVVAMETASIAAGSKATLAPFPPQPPPPPCSVSPGMHVLRSTTARWRLLHVPTTLWPLLHVLATIWPRLRRPEMLCPLLRGPAMVRPLLHTRTTTRSVLRFERMLMRALLHGSTATLRLLRPLTVIMRLLRTATLRSFHMPRAGLPMTTLPVLYTPTPMSPLPHLPTPMLPPDGPSPQVLRRDRRARPAQRRGRHLWRRLHWRRAGPPCRSPLGPGRREQSPLRCGRRRMPRRLRHR